MKQSLVSFALVEAQEALAFFNINGFVVFRSIYSKEECYQTRQTMHKEVEKTNPGLSMDDPKTWDHFKGAG